MRILRWLKNLVGIVVLLIFAVLFFFSWQAGQRESRIGAEAAPSTGRFVAAGDVQIFLQEAGPTFGAPVILIHGTGAWSEIWRDTMTALAGKGFHVIAIDLPPFGFSDKPEGSGSYAREKQAARIVGALDSLNIKQAILVGHSVGARPTLEAALIAPERVSRLVLVDPALGFQADKDSPPKFLQNQPSWLVSTVFSLHPLRNAVLATYGTNPLSTKILFSSFVSKTEAVTDARVLMLQQPLVINGMTRAEGDWLQYLLVDQDNSLGSDFNNFSKLKMPVGIIWGTSDSVTPLWQGEQLHKLIPGSTFKTIEGAGHIPYIEGPDEFNKLLLDALK